VEVGLSTRAFHKHESKEASKHGTALGLEQEHVLLVCTKTVIVNFVQQLAEPMCNGMKHNLPYGNDREYIIY